ncbi:MICOS complex subunit [Abortiporus biennis]
MFRAALNRRAIVSGTTVAVAAFTIPQDKLPIYPQPDPEIVLQETPSELEKQIGKVRRRLTATYDDAHGRVQEVVSKWIGVEQAVEHRVKSIIDPNESLTPGLLYVGVATLTGSVITRNRLLLWRILLPPTLLALSLNHFLPKTSHNLSSYFGSLEDTYFPSLSEKHEIAKAHSQMTWERAKEATKNSRESLNETLVGLLERIQGATGLKLKETLVGAEKAKVEEKEAAQVVVQKVEETVQKVEETAQKAEEVVEKKVEEVKRLV